MVPGSVACVILSLLGLVSLSSSTAGAARKFNVRSRPLEDGHIAADWAAAAYPSGEVVLRSLRQEGSSSGSHKLRRLHSTIAQCSDIADPSAICGALTTDQQTGIRNKLITDCSSQIQALEGLSTTGCCSALTPDYTNYAACLCSNTGLFQGISAYVTADQVLQECSQDSLLSPSEQAPTPAEGETAVTPLSRLSAASPQHGSTDSAEISSPPPVLSTIDISPSPVLSTISPSPNLPLSANSPSRLPPPPVPIDSVTPVQESPPVVTTNLIVSGSPPPPLGTTTLTTTSSDGGTSDQTTTVSTSGSGSSATTQPG